MQAISSSFALGGGARVQRIQRTAVRRGATGNVVTLAAAAPSPLARVDHGERGEVVGFGVSQKNANVPNLLRPNVNVAHAVSTAVRRMQRRVQAVCGAAVGVVNAEGDTKEHKGVAARKDDDARKLNLPLMSAGLLATALSDLNGNHVFMAAFYSWATAQLMKYVTTFYREGRWDWRVMFDSGGMPSSHTSLVVGLTTAIAYGYGLSSVLFPSSLAFSLVVMYDAAGVRRHAGKQAEVLNRILGELVKGEAPSEKKLKEVLGHSPLQVFAGAFLGVGMAIMYMHRYSTGYASLAF